MIKVRNLWRTFTRDRCQRHGTQFEYSRFRTEKFKKNSVRVPRLIINLFSRKETQFPFSLILSKLLQVKLNQNINILNFVLSDKLIFCYFFNSHFFNCPKFIIHFFFHFLDFGIRCRVLPLRWIFWGVKTVGSKNMITLQTRYCVAKTFRMPKLSIFLNFLQIKLSLTNQLKYIGIPFFRTLDLNSQTLPLTRT